MEIQIEKNVIWNMIIHPDRINETLEIISEKDFLHPLYRHAFSTISKLNKEGRTVDLPALYLEMGRPETMSPIIGSDDDTLFGPVHHANLLRQRNIENDISEASQMREYEVIQDRIKELRGLGSPIELGKITEIIEKGEKRNEIIPTGYRDLDKVVKLERTDLMVLAGRPGVGKSLFGCSILANMAIQNVVGVISFEMSEIKIVKRLSYGYSMNYLNEINDNYLISSPSIFNLREVRKTLNEMVLKRGVKVVLIDYLQLMSETKEFRSRHLEISHIIRSLKELAKEFQIVLIVVSSLSRGEKTGESKPILSDLKECVTGGTEIQTNLGNKSIKYIFARKSLPRIKTFNLKTRRIEFITPEKIIRVGKRKCKRIRTKSGKWLTLSEETPLLKNGNEWVRVKDLTVGDKILVEKRDRNVRGGVRFYSGGFSHGNNHWKKGIAVRSSEGSKKFNRGYVMVREDGRYRFEHRNNIEKSIGRQLKKSEYIHHWDGDKTNNALLNLRLCKNAKEHQFIHEKEQRFVENLIKEGRVIFDEEKKEFIYR